MTQIKYKVELVIEDGQIIDVVSLDKENVHVSEPVPSLNEINPDSKWEIDHATVILTGHKNPYCFWVRTSRGYTKVCR